MKKVGLFRQGVLKVGTPDPANDDQPISHKVENARRNHRQPPEHLFFLRRLRTDSDGLGSC